MATHDIIDNREIRLSDNIKQILDSTEAARFAVGYFFLSGFSGIAEKLKNIKELRLLIGNTTTKDTLEQIAEGYRRLEMVAEAAEEQMFPKRNKIRQMAAETADNIRSSMELMDQTDDNEKVIHTLSQMIEEKRLKVKVYTKGRLHAKAYIFDYGKIYDGSGHAIDRHEKGIAIVGSSNLTLSGITHNTELNVIVQGNNNHAELVRWFQNLWEEAQDFDESLIQELRQSWAAAPVRPYDIYMKTVYTLVKDRLEGDRDQEILWDDDVTKRLANFQKVVVKQMVQTIRDYGGAFVADVVGLGKSYIGAAIVKHFERTEHSRPLVICPAPLKEMWEWYNEVYDLHAQILSMGYLRENEDFNILLEDVKYRDRDFVLVDESHNFRHSDTQRYKILQAYLATGRRCCFLTATPRNKSAWDVYNQIKLFHQDDKTYIPIDPPNLREYFKLIERGERKLPDLLSNILIRRTRNHIIRWYGYDANTHQQIDPSRYKEYLDGKKRAYVMVGGRHQFFPKRELEIIEYSIENTYQGLYQRIRSYLGKPRRRQPIKPIQNELTFARYGLWHYVLREKQKKEPYASLHRAGVNLRGIIRILLFKRFESSVFAFRESIRKMIVIHKRFLEAINQGIVPAGEDAQAILYEPNQAEEQDLIDALRKLSQKYGTSDFNLERLIEHINHDIQLFEEILKLVKPITPDRDDKLQTLLNRLKSEPLRRGKRLIFTQYADTARYLYQNLNPDDSSSDIEVIYSGDKSKARVVGRFSPNSNPEYRTLADGNEINTLVATDVLAEGLNLQDCDKMINYDLHWNPVKLIQRFGRIDRIGSEHDRVYGFNFLPETNLDRNLGLTEKLRNRIQEIQDTIGEDSAILDPHEQINREAMYAIYEKRSDKLSLFEDEEDEFVDLNEAEEMMRQLRADRPDEFARITNLRDGIRTVMPSNTKGLYVFCQAGRYQQLLLVDGEGKIVTRDIPRILGKIKCGPELSGKSLPKGYNARVMKIKRQFAEEVKHIQAEREHTLSLTQGQRYVIRELRVIFGNETDDDTKAQINILDKAFRGTITTALNRELNRLRRNGVTGQHLLKTLINLYHQHNMKEWPERRKIETDSEMLPRIICSEGFD